MSKTYVSVTYLTLFQFFVSCNPDQSFSEPEIVDLTKVELTTHEEVIDFFEILPLEENENTLISFIKRVETFEDRYYLINHLDPQEGNILIYDKKGHLVNKIDKLGKGPGEFTAIIDFEIHPKSGDIYLVGGNRKISIFDKQGVFKNELVVNDYIKDLGIMTCNKKHQFISCSHLSKVSEDGKKFDVVRYNSGFTPLDWYFPFQELASYRLGNGFLTASINNEVGYFRHFSDELAYFDCSGLVRTIKYVFPKPVLPPDKFYPLLNGAVSAADYVFNIKYTENTNARLVEYYYDQQRYLSIYRKKSQTYKLIKLSKEGTLPDFKLIAGMSDDRFIYPSQDPESLKNFAYYLSPDLSKCRNPEIVENADPLDDQIYLVLIKYKD